VGMFKEKLMLMIRFLLFVSFLKVFNNSFHSRLFSRTRKAGQSSKQVGAIPLNLLAQRWDHQICGQNFERKINSTNKGFGFQTSSLENSNISIFFEKEKELKEKEDEDRRMRVLLQEKIKKEEEERAEAELQRKRELEELEQQKREQSRLQAKLEREKKVRTENDLRFFR
jgi:hypothetical protein